MEGFSATHHELISPKRPFVSTYTVSSSDGKSDSSSESRTSPVIFQYGKNASTVSVSPIMISSEPASDSKTSPVFFQYGTLPQHRLTSRSSHSPPPLILILGISHTSFIRGCGRPTNRSTHSPASRPASACSGASECWSGRAPDGPALFARRDISRDRGLPAKSLTQMVLVELLYDGAGA